MDRKNRPDLLADYEHDDESDTVSDAELEEASSTKQILIYEDLIRRKLGTLKKNIFEIGRLLYMAKKKFIVHGQFQKWIKTRFEHDFSYPTAVNYMAIYKYFWEKPAIVELVPMTYLLTIIREFKDEAVYKLDEMMKSGGVPEVRARLAEMYKKEREDNPFHERRPVEKIDPLEKVLTKYKEEDHVKYYEWLLKTMIIYKRRARRIFVDYNPFPQIMTDLYKGPYFPDKTLDVLKKLEAEGFLDEIQRGKKLLDDVEQAYLQALEYFEKESNK